VKSVLVTGVAGGIGSATATRFIAAGWRVFGADRAGPDGAKGLAGFLRGDVADPIFWLEEVLPWLSAEAPVHALVNNAAIQVCKPLLDTTPDEWDNVIAINLRSAFLATRTVAPLMTDKSAAIVNVASVHALATSRFIGAYAASKGGLVALTRAAALELADRNIRVNAVLPGAVDTHMLEDGLARNKRASGIVDTKVCLAARTPLGRIGTPAEIAEAVYFLADCAASSFISGQTLVVDGGALARLSTE
jgi:NAD(P)-dependent dehydrogenase (short-subunit alcohol dehydrogenase family)